MELNFNHFQIKVCVCVCVCALFVKFGFAPPSRKMQPELCVFFTFPDLRLSSFSSVYTHTHTHQ